MGLCKAQLLNKKVSLHALKQFNNNFYKIITYKYNHINIYALLSTK